LRGNPLTTQNKQEPDDDLEGDLYRYFVRVQEMSDTEAALAAKKWAAHIRRQKREGRAQNNC
jgi:hypothetical protein